MNAPLLLKAKPVVEKVQSELKSRLALLKPKLGRAPKLVVILVGDHSASQIYVTQKERSSKEVGFEHETKTFPENISPAEVKKYVQKLNEDPTVDGILIQRPLPKTFKEEELIRWVSPEKDVDCFHPENAGLLYLGTPRFAPCTPQGILKLLDHYAIPISGKKACVIGRSTIVGKPMGQLLLSRDATVIQAHSKTKDLPTLTRECDIVIVAAGIPLAFGKEYFSKSTAVVDVGIHRLSNGKVGGDVDFEKVFPEVRALSPVPGGVGPLTITQLLENTLLSAERKAERK